MLNVLARLTEGRRSAAVETALRLTEAPRPIRSAMTAARGGDHGVISSPNSSALSSTAWPRGYAELIEQGGTREPRCLRAGSSNIWCDAEKTDRATALHPAPDAQRTLPDPSRSGWLRLRGRKVDRALIIGWRRCRSPNSRTQRRLHRRHRHRQNAPGHRARCRRHHPAQQARALLLDCRTGQRSGAGEGRRQARPSGVQPDAHGLGHPRRTGLSAVLASRAVRCCSTCSASSMSTPA